MPHVSRLAGLVATALAAALLTPATTPVAAAGPPVAQTPPAEDARPNIVVVQLDDVSRELMRTMSQAARMADEGVRFTRSFVVDSLCCPSRASFFTGRTPHHTGVRTNTAGVGDALTGGWQAYRARGNPAITFHRRMQEETDGLEGYDTGFVGKFLNGYSARTVRTYGEVPGWDEFVPVLASGYRGWDFDYAARDAKGRFRRRTVEKPPASASDAVKDRAYVQSFMERRALDFIDRHEGGTTPYLYVLSTYSAHSRVGGPAYAGDPLFPPAFADRPGGSKPGGNCGEVACRDLDVRQAAAWGDSRQGNRPLRLVDGRLERGRHWRPARPTEGVRTLDAKLRQRAQMLQSVDRTLERILDRVGGNTYVVLTSDNGYHLGQYQLDGGKGTPYDTDTRVPLYVVGPGVAQGAERTQQVTNLDLAPTIESLAGLPTNRRHYRDGVSFADLLGPGGGSEAGGRRTFFEHTMDRRNGPDGEAEGDSRLGFIPSYVGVRSSRGLLVRFDLDPAPQRARYAWELYTYANGFEDTNVFRPLHREPWVQDLRTAVRRWSTCEPTRCGPLTR